MAPKQLKRFVVGCNNEYSSRHLLPTFEPLKTQLITSDLPKCVNVHANH